MEKQNKTVNLIVVLNDHCNAALLFFKQQYAYSTIQEQDLKNKGLKEYLCFILPKNEKLLLALYPNTFREQRKFTSMKY